MMQRFVKASKIIRFSAVGTRKSDGLALFDHSTGLLQSMGAMILIRNNGTGAENGNQGDRPNGALDGGAKYSVIKIDHKGNLETLNLNLAEMGIHPRDMDVLIGNSFIPRRSTLAARYDKILVRMESVRALVSRDQCLLFDAQRTRRSPTLKSTNGTRGEAPVHKAREAFAGSLADYAKEKPPEHFEPMPFHLRMMECLLEETSNFFNQKAERLKVVVERALEDLTKDVSTGGLKRLLPLKRALTEVEHDIRDTHEAIDQVLSSDDMLHAFCLETLEGSYMGVETELKKGTIRQIAADMLLTYLREVDDAGAVLEELRKEMDAAQEVWELGLDTTRNRVITTNLYISFATLSLTAATVPASFFGMNLTTGFESDPNMFRIVALTTSLTAMTLGLGTIFFFRVWPRFVDKRRAQDLAALNDLLQHIDDIDDVFQTIEIQASGNQITKEQFQQIMRSHPSARFMRQREIDLMFRMFDKNRNGLLEDCEQTVFSQRIGKFR